MILRKFTDELDAVCDQVAWVLSRVVAIRIEEVALLDWELESAPHLAPVTDWFATNHHRVRCLSGEWMATLRGDAVASDGATPGEGAAEG